MRKALPAIAVAAILAAGFGAFEPVRVTSHSMLPSLRDGELLWLNKLAYRFRAPERGEVVVICVAREGEGEEEGQGARRFVKRLIGLPGERIDLIDEQVFVDGDPLPWRKGEPFEDASGKVFASREVSLGSRRVRVLDDATRHTEQGSYALAPNEYFVLGDHRDHSEDSRSFGPILREELQGPVVGRDR